MSCDCVSFLSDMIKRRNLRTRNIKTLILDEADEMLNKGTVQELVSLLDLASSRIIFIFM